MLTNHVKIAWRSLMKDKQFTALNVLGLSAGLACSLLIFLWVSDELSVDKFFENDDRLYRLVEVNGTGEVMYNGETPGPIGPAAKQTLPEVQYAATIAPATWFAPNTLSVNDVNIKAKGQYVEKEYFDIFSFEFLQGDKSNAFASSSSIVLTEELATKLFGTTNNVLGRSVKFDHDTTFYVSAILKNIPTTSTQQFDFVLSFEYFKSIKQWVTQWNSIGPHNYVLLREGTDINQFNKNVENIIKTNTGDTDRRAAALKFSDGYLYNQFGDKAASGGRIQYVNLFTALAIFTLLIACINFMNLSTAKASRRLKEIGIKKVVGAHRTQLIAQFLVESFLLTVLAMIIAVGLAVWLLPQFNLVTGKTISLNFTWQMLAAIAVIALVTGFLAGSYPAFYISGFKPLAILKGKLQTSAAELISRKGLVVFQFTLSTILIVAVSIIYQQVQFIRDTDPGYNKENVVRITAEGKLKTSQESFLAQMKQVPGVVNSAYTFHNIVGHSYSTGLDWPGRDTEQYVYFEVFGVSPDFIKTMGMELKEGRDFMSDYRSDSLNIIVNEEAVRTMNLKSPVGTVVKFNGSDRRIIGVLKDFHFESMHEAIKPIFMHLQKGEGAILARIKHDNQRQTLAGIEELFKTYNPGFPFAFNFLDEAYQSQYVTETRTATLSGYFAGLAILISCLGLFGLAAFMAQKRRKEIGIRKVIGAPVARIIAMLSGDFLKLVCIALVIAFPVSWWIMSSWLQNYTYRINITPGVFIMVAGLVLIITLCVIGFQTIRAAIANPVKTLRSE